MPPSERPRMTVLAGPNGSGKSTVTDALMDSPAFPAIYVNADDIGKWLDKPSNDASLKLRTPAITEEDRAAYKRDAPGMAASLIERERERGVELTQAGAERRVNEGYAANLADRARATAVQGDRPFAFESVMSTPGKLALFDEARNKGFDVDLVFVTTASGEINKQRVQDRVAKGGHPVDVAKIGERYERAMDLLPLAVEKSKTAQIFDNSVHGKAPKLVAEKLPDGSMRYPQGDETPRWVNERMRVPLVQREKSRAELAVAADQVKPGLSGLMVEADIGRGLSYKGLVAKTTDQHVMQFVPGQGGGPGALVLHDRSVAPPGDYAALQRPEHRGTQVEIGYPFGVDGKLPPGTHVTAPAVAQAQVQAQPQPGQMPPPGQEPPAQGPRSKL